jgi:N-acetylneuraminic acid mutarotase
MRNVYRAVRKRAGRRQVSMLASLAVIALLAAACGPGPVVNPDAWTAKAPVPSIGAGVEGMAVGATSPTLIVAAYGFDNGIFGDTNATRLYHVDTDSWTSGTTAPLPVRSEEGSVVVGGSLYAVGGRTALSTPLSDVDRYDPGTNSWTVLANMPTARAGVGVAATGGVIYAIGGRSGPVGPCSGGETATVEAYNIATNTWTTVAPLPSARSDVGAMAVGGKVYAFGGCTAAGGAMSDAEVYDPVTNTWSPRAPLPTAAAGFYGLAFADQESPEVYIVGGEGAGATPLSITQVYKVAFDVYDLNEPPLLTPRAEMGVTAAGNFIYAIGGARPCCGTSSNANEAATI